MTATPAASPTAAATRAPLSAAPGAIPAPAAIAAVLPPPYALEPVAFSAPALADCAQAAALGGDREMALAALMTARLMLAALPPVDLAEPERITRADRARTWLSAVTMPQPARMALLRTVDASITGGPEATATLRELMQVLSGHLSPAALQELAVIAERLRLYYEQTP